MRIRSERYYRQLSKCSQLGTHYLPVLEAPALVY